MARKLPFVLIAFILAAGCGGPAVEMVKAGPMPEGGDFTGVYHSPQYGEMNLVQNGNSVIGEYKKDERTGRINGSVDGDVLRFDWVEKRALVLNKPVESKGKGYFRYMIDASTKEHVLKGEWGSGNQMKGGGPWNAWKSLKAKPQLSGDLSGSQASGSDQSSSGQTEGTSQPPRSDLEGL
jgi:hypothetical protein